VKTIIEVPGYGSLITVDGEQRAVTGNRVNKIGEVELKHSPWNPATTRGRDKWTPMRQLTVRGNERWLREE
jgi:hypothetical protein